MRFRILGLAVLLLGGLVQSSFGAIITNGHFDISGTVFVTQAGAAPVITPAGTCAIGVACIFFQDPTGLNGFVDITSTGLPNGNIPVSISGNDTATIAGLANPPNVVGGAGFPNQPFMSFIAATGVTTQLMINLIDPGIFTAVNCGAPALSGTTCTLPGSLFNFTNNPPPTPAGTPCGTQCQATATWVVEGTTSGNPAPQSHWIGNFTAQFPVGVPYQTVFTQLAANGFVSNSFSATITLIPSPGVPEPGSLLMIGSGLLGLAAFLRRRTAR